MFIIRSYLLLSIVSLMQSSLCALPLTTLVSAPSQLLSSEPTPSIINRKKKKGRTNKSSFLSNDAITIELDDSFDVPTSCTTESTDSREERSQNSNIDKDSIDTSRDHHSKMSQRIKRKRSLITTKEVENEESSCDTIVNDHARQKNSKLFDGSLFEDESTSPGDCSLAAIGVLGQNCCIVLDADFNNNDWGRVAKPDDDGIGCWQNNGGFLMTSSSPSILIQTGIDKSVEKSIHSKSSGKKIAPVTTTPACYCVGEPVKINCKPWQHRQKRTINAKNAIKERETGSPAARKKKKLSISSRLAKTGSMNNCGSGKDGDCLRRIKREWKEFVQMGIAYDWTNMRTIHDQHNSINNSLGSTENDRDYMRIGPFNKNMLRWHFSIKGPHNSVYEQGVYHGLILLPKNYPAMPPRIQMLTPNGRFMTNVDICLSASNYHPETWTPKWTILSLVNALRLHMLTLANEIGGIISSDESKRWYARESRFWRQSYNCVGGNCNGEGVVVVDHSHMIASGVFKSSSTIPAMTTTEIADDCYNSLSRLENEKNTHNEQDTFTTEVKGHQCYFEGDSSKINNNDFLELSCRRISSKYKLSNAMVIPSQLEALKSTEATKINQKKKKSITFSRNSHEPIIKSKVVKAADSAWSVKDNGSNRRERRFICLTTQIGQETPSKKNSTTEHLGSNISNGMFKRLIVDVLELPLQIILFILTVLSEVESRLRAVIDSFVN
ncbi:hypothetical protein ACHAXA_004038 [Cyclostephanos tholiformis]|uniref:UBC core domain-containing protein n=1 Tax=Cyclostephanos tholiformis TaxID=382380 RepID=A0ABD3REY1_9STRA